jgi:hypothetical protein
LLLFGDMQIKLKNVCVVVDQTLLESVDPIVTNGPDVCRCEIVDPHNQHVLVVRAIEDDYFPSCGHSWVYPPQEVVCQLFGGGLSKGGHSAALGIHRTQKVIDRSILAAGVHCLQTDQQRTAALRIQQVLKFA